MKLDGNAIYYLLSKRFDDVACYQLPRSMVFDYPRLYDEHDDMSGHTVFVPDNVLLDENCAMRDALCVCSGEAAAHAAAEAGFPVIHVRDAVTMQHLYNGMHADHVTHERLDARLRAFVDTRAGFPPLLDSFARTMGCSCALADKRLRVIAQADAQLGSASSWLEETLDEGDFDLFMASRDYRRKRSARYIFALPGKANVLTKNIIVKEESVGSLFMIHEGTVESERYARFVIGYLAPFIEKMYVHLGSFDWASEGSTRIQLAIERAFSGELTDFATFDRILGAWPKSIQGNDDPESPDDRLASESTFAVLRFERSFTNEGAEGLDYLAHRVEIALPWVYTAVADDALFALADVSAFESRAQADFEQSLAQFARETLVKVGMSRYFPSTSQLLAARAQASAALEQGNEANPSFWVYRFSDYALAWLVSHGKGPYPSEYVAHPTAVALARFDEAHHAGLTDTLRMFMKCRYNATETAANLFIARSTLLYRLARIQEIAPVNLDDFRERIYLALSLELLSD